MKKTILLAGLGCLALALPCAAEDDMFETEITIDLEDLGEDGEIDLSELFGDADFEYDEDAYEEEDETDDPDDFLEEDQDVYWYTVRYHEDDQDMVMLNDVILYLPEDWTDKYDMILKDDRVDFYHTASRAAWYLKGNDGGKLFSLCTSPEQDYEELPDYEDMGQGSDGLYYYLLFPTDAQAFTEDEAIAEEYEQLWDGIDRVRDESFSLNDYFVGDEELEEMTEETIED